MIKINEEFSAKRYIRGWELHHTTPSENPSAKKSYKTDVTYYPNFNLLASKVIDVSIGNVEDLHEVKWMIAQTASDICTAVRHLDE